MADLTLALFQPDIPQNAGTMLRACACLGIDAAIIEPAGFLVSDRNFRRSGMDYLDRLRIERHVSWSAFEDWRKREGRRLVLLTTQASVPYTSFSFAPGDVVLVGREFARSPGGSPRLRRRPHRHPHAARHALSQRRLLGGHGDRRGFATDSLSAPACPSATPGNASLNLLPRRGLYEVARRSSPGPSLERSRSWISSPGASSPSSREARR